MKLGLITSLFLSVGYIAQGAAIFYSGTLSEGVPVVGSVDGTVCGICGDGITGLNFWSFSGNAGDVVTIAGTRNDFNLDPAFVLYFGTTTADDSTTLGFDFFATVDFDSMTFLAIRDDDVANAGPFGDPLLSGFALPSTGLYTILAGSASAQSAPASSYNLVITGLTTTSTPEPGTLGLTASGLLGLAAFGWRRRNVTKRA
jgi:hypothetical protein